MKSELKDRILWFDGTSQVSPERVAILLLEGLTPDQIVSEETEDLLLFNNLSDEQIEFSKQGNRPLDISWNIPYEYMHLDIESVFWDLLEERGLSLNPLYNQRLGEELQEVQLRGLQPLYRTLIYIVARFRETNTVWGVGRGSSCASLCLFLIRLHLVDPVKYQIPLSEFLHS